MNTRGLQASVVVALNPHASDPAPVFEAYLRQTLPATAFEVIVADGGTRPGVAQAHAAHLRAFPSSPVRLIETGGPGRAAANNAGARAARSELLVFVADDFIPAPTLVRAHVEFHRHLCAPAVGVGPAFFTAARRADPFCRWLEDSGRLFGIPFRIAEQRWSRRFFYVGNASLARALFEGLGAFDEAFRHDLFDDFEFGLRLAAAGVRAHFLPKALAWHDHDVTVAERAEAMRRSGVAARHCEARHVAFRPWADLAARPLAELAAALHRAEESARGAATGAARGDWYLAQMDYAFAEGYHGAAATPETTERAP